MARRRGPWDAQRHHQQHRNRQGLRDAQGQQQQHPEVSEQGQQGQQQEKAQGNPGSDRHHGQQGAGQSTQAPGMERMDCALRSLQAVAAVARQQQQQQQRGQQGWHLSWMEDLDRRLNDKVGVRDGLCVMRITYTDLSYLSLRLSEFIKVFLLCSRMPHTVVLLHGFFLDVTEYVGEC